MRVNEKLEDSHDITSLSELDRTVFLVWTTMGILDNGGFEYLVEHEAPDVSLVAQAFREIECEPAALVIEEFSEILRETNDDSKKYAATSEIKRKKINRDFWSLSEVGEGRICQDLATYIRAEKER